MKKSNKGLNKSIELFRALENNNIKHCHWKSNQHLKEAIDGLTDIDLLVDKEELQRIELVLIQLGYKRILSQAWVTYPGIEDWLGFDDDNGSLIHIHLHYQIVTGKKYVKDQALPYEKYILKNTTKDINFDVNIVEPNLELILLIMRIALKSEYLKILQNKVVKNKLFPQNIYDEFQYLINKLDSKILNEHLNNIVYNTNLKNIINQIVRKESINLRDIISIKKCINSELRAYNRMSFIKRHFIMHSNKLKSKIYSALNKLNIPVRLRKRFVTGGKIIIFIGADGSGKSTISNAIEKWLNWKIDAKKVYLGSGDGRVGAIVRVGNLYNKLKFQMLNKTANSTLKNIQNELKQTPFACNENKKIPFLRNLESIISSYFRLSLAKDRYKKVTFAKKMAVDGKIILTDRFPQNQIFGYYDGPSIKTYSNSFKLQKMMYDKEKLLYKSIEKVHPDIVIKLNISPAEAIKRKPDHDIDNIELKQKTTVSLTFPNSKVYEIDANKNLEEVLKIIKIIIWSEI